MADIFDELHEDLRAERTRALAWRYGALGAVLLVVALLAAGGYQAWQWNQRREATAAAAPFIATMNAADLLPASGAAPARQAFSDAFAKIADTAPAGYRTLARLRAAALQADAGQLDAALRTWDQVSADTGADPLLRSLADLLWVEHQIDSGDPVLLASRLQGLDTNGAAWRPLAQEARALIALRQGDHAAATRILQALMQDPSASQGVRGRAQGMLAVMGETEAKG